MDAQMKLQEQMKATRKAMNANGRLKKAVTSDIASKINSSQQPPTPGQNQTASQTLTKEGQKNGSDLSLAQTPEQNDQSNIASPPSQGANSLACAMWGWPSISADGRYVVFGTFSNGIPWADPHPLVFLKDMEMNQVWSLGEGSNPVISGNGNTVAFYSPSPGPNGDLKHSIIHVTVYDRQSGSANNLSIELPTTWDDAGHRDIFLSHDGGAIGFANRFDAYSTPFFYDRASGKAGGSFALSTASAAFTLDGRVAAQDNYRGDGFGPVITNDAGTVIGHGILLNASDDGNEILFEGSTTSLTLWNNGTLESFPCTYMGTLSGNGKYVTCVANQPPDGSDTNNPTDVYRYDVSQNTSLLVTEGSSIPKTCLGVDAPAQP